MPLPDETTPGTWGSEPTLGNINMLIEMLETDCTKNGDCILDSDLVIDIIANLKYIHSKLYGDTVKCQ